MVFQRSSLFTLVICVSHRKYRLKETEGPTHATESVGSRMDGDPVSSQTEGAVSQQAVTWGGVNLLQLWAPHQQNTGRKQSDSLDLHSC